MGYLGDERLGVKRVGDLRIGQKNWRWEKINVWEQKNGRNSKLRKGAGRLGEIKVGYWVIQAPIVGLINQNSTYLVGDYRNFSR